MISSPNKYQDLNHVFPEAFQVDRLTGGGVCMCVWGEGIIDHQHWARPVRMQSQASRAHRGKAGVGTVRGASTEEAQRGRLFIVRVFVGSLPPKHRASLPIGAPQGVSLCHLRAWRSAPSPPLKNAFPASRARPETPGGIGSGGSNHP